MNLKFLLHPFDPQNNLLLFDKFVSRFFDTDIVADDVEAVLQRFEIYRQLYPDTTFPTDDDVRAIWDDLQVSSKYLVATHDIEHALRDVDQDVAGEYELAIILALQPRNSVDRIYGVLAASTLTLGILRSHSTKPIQGIVKGLKRALCEDTRLATSSCAPITL
jgi:ubiquinone biosynthesis protein Coq4